jgi:membrane protein DedA with SNARE-associated domain
MTPFQYANDGQRTWTRGRNRAGPALWVRHLHESHLTPAHAFFERHGPKTVFIGRFNALLRTWAAVLAGAAHKPYSSFVLCNALGAVCWAVLVGTPGYVFGRNLPQLERYIGQADAGRRRFRHLRESRVSQG